MSVPSLVALKALEGVERELSALYTKLSEQFAADADLSALFFRLAKDERSHQILVQYQQRMARANPETFGPVEIDLALVGELTNQIASFCRETPDATAAAALRAAIGFETHAAERLHRTVVSAASSGFSALVERLGKEDSKHCATLDGFLRARASG